jgi:hypothetical protein
VGCGGPNALGLGNDLVRVCTLEDI